MGLLRHQFPGNNGPRILRASQRLLISVVMILLGAMLYSATFRAQSSGSPKEFVIYFPQGSSIVTANAYGVALYAAETADSGNHSKVVIIGHCDTSERSPQELSRKRADNAAAALRAAGLNEGLSVQTSNTGAKDLAVPTPENTSEPLNRRVVIDIE
jgi:outer membrane protein OmpA-like peptidoglycan-associated protein